MNAPQLPTPQDADRPDDESLSSDLQTVLARVRDQAASAEMVERLQAKLLRSIEPASARRRGLVLRSGWVAAALVFVVLGTTLALWPKRGLRPVPVPHPLDNHLREAMMPVVYSPVTRTPFAEVAFPRIDADMLRFEAELHQASDIVTRTELLREIDATVDEFSSWNRRR